MPNAARAEASARAEVGVLAVHLVDEDHARDTALLGQPPGLLGADLDAGRGVDDDDGRVGHAQGGLHVADEVGVAGRVDDVDLGVPPLDGGHAGADGDAPLDLVRVEIGDGVAFVDPAQAGGGLGVEEERLRQRRLPRTAVREQADVADAIGGILFHGALRCLTGNR